MKRQKIRKLILLISLLLFPVTIWYFSPAIIMNALLKHIINGSFIVFSAMLVFSMFFGRVFCGYLCPAGGLQECVMQVNDNKAKGGWRNYIKFVIWIVWLVILVIFYLSGKGAISIDPFFMTDHGISVSEITDFIIYYMVVALLFIPALIHGRRASCHYLCWMAPFMIVGSKVGKALHIPQLHVVADTEKCISCGKCNKNCPMSLDVKELIKENKNICNSECINCGSCVDSCPNKTLKYSMKWK